MNKHPQVHVAFSESKFLAHPCYRWFGGQRLPVTPVGATVWGAVVVFLVTVQVTEVWPRLPLTGTFF